jgi:hypothetical protein
MPISQMRFARLDRQKLTKLREVETELGGWLVVLEPEMETVELPDEQAQLLKQIEANLGVTLMACAPPQR